MPLGDGAGVPDQVGRLQFSRQVTVRHTRPTTRARTRRGDARRLKGSVSARASAGVPMKRAGVCRTARRGQQPWRRVRPRGRARRPLRGGVGDLGGLVDAPARAGRRGRCRSARPRVACSSPVSRRRPASSAVNSRHHQHDGRADRGHVRRCRSSPPTTKPTTSGPTTGRRAGPRPLAAPHRGHPDLPLLPDPRARRLGRHRPVRAPHRPAGQRHPAADHRGHAGRRLGGAPVRGAHAGAAAQAGAEPLAHRGGPVRREAGRHSERRSVGRHVRPPHLAQARAHLADRGPRARSASFIGYSTLSVPAAAFCSAASAASTASWSRAARSARQPGGLLGLDRRVDAQRLVGLLRRRAGSG